jgi:HicA toxin of bacterial toxin-antitoxin,
MGTKEKLIERFKRQPKDFTFDELCRLFRVLGFEISQKGKTSGSRVEFINNEKGLSYGAHKPHPDSTIKSYVMKQVLDLLKSNELI